MPKIYEKSQSHLQQETSMQVQIHTDQAIEGHEALANRVSEVVKERIIRFSDRIPHVDRQAPIVTLTEQGEKIHKLISEVEKQLRRSGDSPLKGSYEALQIPADDSRQRALTGKRNAYYDEVIGQIRDAVSIRIVGPGDAKYELQKRLEENQLRAKVVEVETVDRLKEPQLLAKVQQHFAK